MDNKSSLGDWAFLVGVLVIVSGLFAYENMGAIQQWLMTMTQTNVSASVDGSFVEWLAQNWGVAILVAAFVLAAIRMIPMKQKSAVDEVGPTVNYRRHKFIKVKLVR